MAAYLEHLEKAEHYFGVDRAYALKTARRILREIEEICGKGDLPMPEPPPVPPE